MNDGAGGKAVSKVVKLDCLVCGRKRGACKSLRACVVYTSREANKLRAQLATLKAAAGL